MGVLLYGFGRQSESGRNREGGDFMKNMVGKLRESRDGLFFPARIDL